MALKSMRLRLPFSHIVLCFATVVGIGCATPTKPALLDFSVIPTASVFASGDDFTLRLVNRESVGVSMTQYCWLTSLEKLEGKAWRPVKAPGGCGDLGLSVNAKSEFALTIRTTVPLTAGTYRYVVGVRRGDELTVHTVISDWFLIAANTR